MNEIKNLVDKINSHNDFTQENKVALKNPLHLEEIKKQMQENEEVVGVIAISVSDLISKDVYAIEDVFSNKIVGTKYTLWGQEYHCVGADEQGNVLLEVSGYVDDWVLDEK